MTTARGPLRRRLDVLQSKIERRLTAVGDPLAVAFTPNKGSRADDVLVVKLDAIGDFVLWLGVAPALRRLYPSRRITLIGNAAWAELAALLPYWDEVWAVEPGRLRRLGGYRARTLRAVRRRAFGTVLHPVYSREFLLGDALVRASQAPVRVGFDGDLNNISPSDKAISDRWYTRLLPARRERLNEAQRNAEFFALLSGQPCEPAYARLPPLIGLPQRLALAGRYLVLFPGASVAYRQWPAAAFAEVANRIGAERGLSVVLCGSAGEAALCDRVRSRLVVESVNLAGSTSLPEFFEVVRRADLLIGNETSAIHIASAVGTPAVCLLGGGHYGRFMPYIATGDALPAPVPAVHPMPCFGCDWRCTQPHEPGGPVPCISGISAAAVLDASRLAVGAGTRRAG